MVPEETKLTTVFLRQVQAELYGPTIEPQDYEMVEFFIKRLKLWMGITKAKEVRVPLRAID